MLGDRENFRPKFRFSFHGDNNVPLRHNLSRGNCDDAGRDDSAHSIDNGSMDGKTKRLLTGHEEAVISRTREARGNTDLNQEQVAAILGIDRSTYAKYETIRIMDTEHMSAFCNMFGITLDYLLTGRENPIIEKYTATSGDSRAIVDKFLGLTVKQHESEPEKPSQKKTNSTPTRV